MGRCLSESPSHPRVVPELVGVSSVLSKNHGSMYIDRGILPYPRYYVLLGDIVELGANLVLQKELVDESLECSHGSVT